MEQRSDGGAEIRSSPLDGWLYKSLLDGRGCRQRQRAEHQGMQLMGDEGNDRKE